MSNMLSALICFHSFIEAQKESLLLCLKARNGVKVDKPILFIYPKMIEEPPFFMYNNGSIDAYCLKLTNDASVVDPRLNGLVQSVGMRGVMNNLDIEVVDPLLYEGKFVITDESTNWDFRSTKLPQKLLRSESNQMVNTLLGKHGKFFVDIPRDSMDTVFKLSHNLIYMKRALYSVCNS
ncbi:hypothetical protein [Ruminiclostridium cellobioparum]|uniref:hypothetical protein n=1 Tax=Ruminiclostridium cellobioparum TaxID=29355 RepID=UPI0028AD5064|nr:hypothetical protein [Ruminiclostridium cellobioparum]